MGNPSKDFPCEVAPDRLSRGYAESKPFVLAPMGTDWNYNPKPIKVVFESDLEAELRKEITSIVNCVKDISSRADWATNELVELFYEWRDK